MRIVGKGGTSLGMKQYTVAFVNNFQHVAEGVGRMPTAHLCAFLRREGAVKSTVAMFRPQMVRNAVNFLLANNVVFKTEWGSRAPVDFGDAEEVYIDEADMVDMTEEEAEAVKLRFAESDVVATTEADIVLYHSEADDPLSREDHIRANLKAKKKGTGTTNFNLPRGGVSGLAHPMHDKKFYEKAFPCLFPYGYGGPEDQHKLKEKDYVELLLKRGGSADMRRFGKYVPYMLAVYSYRMKKIAGGVAYIASMNAEASGDSAAAPSGEGADAHGERSNLFAQIQSAPDAKSIIEALQTNNGELANKILRRLEPYSERLVGSPSFISHERKLLYGMLGSSVVRDSGSPGIFSTIAPNDRFYPELPFILRTSKARFLIIFASECSFHFHSINTHDSFASLSLRTNLARRRH
jgi:hypothetical protein